MKKPHTEEEAARINAMWNRISVLLHSKGISIGRMSQDIGCTRSYLSSARTRGFMPPTNKLIEIADKLEVSVGYLISGSNVEDDPSDEAFIAKLSYRMKNEPVFDSLIRTISDMSNAQVFSLL